MIAEAPDLEPAILAAPHALGASRPLSEVHRTGTTPYILQRPLTDSGLQSVRSAIYRRTFPRQRPLLIVTSMTPPR